MNLREQISSAMRGTVVVIGMGNPCRGDDEAGSRVARKIAGAHGVHVIDAQDVPENYLCQVTDRRPDTVVLIDSVDLKATPGSVALLEKDQVASYWPSTHRVPAYLLMNYLERETHARVFLLAIQPSQADFSRPLSAAVSSSIEAIASILNEIFAIRLRLAQARVLSQSREAPT